MTTLPDPHLARAHAEQAAAALAPLVAGRLAGILARLADLVAARFRILGPVTNPLWGRISRASWRLGILLAHFAAGRRPRAHVPRPGRKSAPPATRPLAARLPTRRAWLAETLGYEAAIFASGLRHLFNDPAAAAALVEAARAWPGIARTLRPLCRMLGVVLPPFLQPPARPPRPRPAKPERPRPAPPPPMRPIYPQRRPRDLPFLRPPPAAQPA